MSILETFFILFKTNSVEIKKGTQEAGKEVDQLEAKIKSSDVVANQLGSSFVGLIKQAGAAFIAIASIQKVISGTFEAAHFADDLGEVAHGLGVSVELLSAWSDATKFAGGTATSAQESFKALSGSLAQIDATGHSRVKPFFDELGVQLEDVHGKIRPINDLLLDVAGKFEHMSKQESFGFGRKLQLDEGTIRLLQRGRKGVEDLLAAQKELGVVTEEDAEIGRQWREQVDEMEHASRGFFLTIAKSTFPVLEDGMKWVINNGPILKATIEGLTAAVTLFWTATKIGVIATAWRGAAAAGVTFFEFIITYGTLALEVIGGIISAPAAIIVGLTALFGALIYHWEQVKNYVLSGIDEIRDRFSGIGNFFGIGNSTHEAIIKGKADLSAAGTSSIGSQTSNVFSNSIRSSNKLGDLTIQKMEIHTQATDSNGIAGGIHEGLKHHFRQTTSNYDDGVAG